MDCATGIDGAAAAKDADVVDRRHCGCGGSVFLALAVAAPIWANIARVQQAARTEALHREGLEITGKVTRLWSRGRSRAPMVSYAFTVDGVAHESECSVPSDVRTELSERGPLTIRYVASSPEINHPAAWEAPVSGWGEFAAAIIFASTAILLLTQVRGQRRLVAEGVPTAGVVTGRFSGRRGGRRVDYQFRTSDGRVAKGTSSGDAAIGAPICVLYLPEKPRRNVVYGSSYYRVVQ